MSAASLTTQRSKIRCLVLSSSGEFYGPLHDVLKSAGKEASLLVVTPRETELQPFLSKGVIDRSIFADINRADLILADVSRHNPIIFFEIGYAQALGKPVTLLMEEDAPSPPPLGLGTNYISYKNTPEGLSALKQILSVFFVIS